jgi:endonuclease/exonuclease/phosphatase (EEP) superfamily protein YafD
LQNENIIIAGDLNTSFIENEKRHLPQINSRAELLDFTNLHNVNRSTENIENCIDHIFVSQKLFEVSNISTSTFLENNILNDEPHKGIILNLDFDIK